MKCNLAPFNEEIFFWPTFHLSLKNAEKLHNSIISSLYTKKESKKIFLTSNYVEEFMFY